MASFFAGLLTGAGQYVHEQNRLEQQREHESRVALAEMYDRLGKAAEMEGQADHASRLHSMAFQVRSTPPGKKLAKELLDTRAALLGPAVQPMEAPPPPSPIQMPGTSLPLPPGYPGAEQVPGPASGGAGAVATGGGPAATPPPAFGTAPGGTSELATNVPPPAQGFTIPGLVLAPPPGMAVRSPAEQGLVKGPDGQWHQSPVGTPERRALLDEQRLRRRYGIENEMELGRMANLKAFEKALDKKDVEERIAALKTEGIWDKLNPVQQTSVRLGAKTVPNVMRPVNVPGLLAGKDIPAGATDIFDQPVDPNSMYRIREVDGKREYIPETGRSQTKLIEDPPGSGKWFYATLNQAGHEISRLEAPVPTALRSRTTTSQRIVDVGGEKRIIPVSSTTTRGGGGGGGTASVAAPTRTGGGAGATAPGAAPGRAIGPSNAAYRQGLPTAATKTMMETAPKVEALANEVLRSIDEQQKQLGPLASRWQEYMVGKVGAPNPKFTELRTNAALLSTLLLRMHVGARGGDTMLAHFKGLLDSGKQSPENMRAAIAAIKKYAGVVKSGGHPPEWGPSGEGTVLAPPAGSPGVQRWGRDAQGNPVRLP